jgi:nucleoid-associated protein YgaU
MSPKHLPVSGFFLLIVVGLYLTFASFSRADEVQLKPDHPERYTVVKGDTLWDISTRFLKSPWHWPKIWKINDQIKNPHLIYPGDVVVLRMVDGKPELMVLRKETVTAPGLPSLSETAKAREPAAGPTPTDERTVKLGPQVHSESLDAAIPTIPPNAILPFLTRPLVVGENELEQAGYITTGLDDRIALGNGSQFYARSLKDEGPEYYQIVRLGKPIRHPDTGELLAYEAVYLGNARRLETGDPSKLVVTEVKQEIIPTDRLVEAPKKASLPYYYPRAPKTQVEGRIVSALNAVDEIGPLTVVGITLGTREGIEEGNVLRVMRHAGLHKDPVTRERYKLPDEESALVMVFRTYEKMSYALVMTATQPVHMLDAVITP